MQSQVQETQAVPSPKTSFKTGRVAPKDDHNYVELHSDENKADSRPFRFGQAKAKKLLRAIHTDVEGLTKMLEDYVGAK